MLFWREKPSGNTAGFLKMLIYSEIPGGKLIYFFNLPAFMPAALRRIFYNSHFRPA